MTIRWDKVNSLSGGTTAWPQGVGLAPWYLAAYNQTATTFPENSTAPPVSTVAAAVASSAIAAGPALPGVLPCLCCMCCTWVLYALPVLQVIEAFMIYDVAPTLA